MLTNNHRQRQPLVLDKKTSYILLTALALLGCIAVAGYWLVSGIGETYPVHQYPAALRTAVPKLPGAEAVSVPGIDQTQPLSPTSPAAHSSDFSHLHLIGTAANSENPYAVIYNETSGAQGLFQKGDSIEDGLLKDIASDRIVLQFEGKLLTLKMQSGVSNEKEMDQEIVPNAAPPVYELSYLEQENIETAWSETRELMEQIEFSQFEQNNEPSGIMVARVVKDSTFEKIGLQPGDVIVSVNDMSMTIADDAMEIYNCLRTEQIISFKINRNGETIALEYNQAD